LSHDRLAKRLDEIMPFQLAVCGFFSTRPRKFIHPNNPVVIANAFFFVGVLCDCFKPRRRLEAEIQWRHDNAFATHASWSLCRQAPLDV
jgi:hypothetical protein